MDKRKIQEKLADPAKRGEALNELGMWMVDTCLLFGCSTSTAYALAFVFTEGLAAEWEDRKPDYRIAW
jgi:hypothetical protein